jgi:hypothetical protein
MITSGIINEKVTARYSLILNEQINKKGQRLTTLKI